MTDPTKFQATNDPIIEIDLEGVTYRQLYDMVVENDEIIITINKDDLYACKRGLTVHKSRAKQKMKEAGLVADDTVLRFDEIKIKGPDGKINPDLIKLHIICGAPKTVPIHKIELPDHEI